MSKGRMNEMFFLKRFAFKTKKECEALAKELLIGCQRTGQASIAFMALQKKFGGYKDQQLKEIQLDHDIIRKEAATGATFEYLTELFGISKTKLDKILNEKDKLIPELQIEEVEVDKTVNAFEELMKKAETPEDIPVSDEKEVELPEVSNEKENENVDKPKKKGIFELRE